MTQIDLALARESPSAIKRRLAAIAFADIAGFPV